VYLYYIHTFRQSAFDGTDGSFNGLVIISHIFNTPYSRRLHDLVFFGLGRGRVTYNATQYLTIGSNHKRVPAGAGKNITMGVGGKNQTHNLMNNILE
jgi:hypothetical protein